MKVRHRVLPRPATPAVSGWTPSTSYDLPGTPWTSAAGASSNRSTGTAARNGDLLYGARRILHTGVGLLTDTQTARLNALFAADVHVEVEATWRICASASATRPVDKPPTSPSRRPREHPTQRQGGRGRGLNPLSNPGGTKSRRRRGATSS